jgi:hypothetical protein
MERGGKSMEHFELTMFTVASNVAILESLNSNLLSRFGKVGMRVNIGHPMIVKTERRGGKGGNKRLYDCEELASSSLTSSFILHHPLNLLHFHKMRISKDGKNVLDIRGSS